YLWWASVAIMFLLPIFMLNSGRNNTAAQREIDKIVVVSPSMVERFGLPTIIVLGEVVVGVVSGLSDQHHLTLEVGVIALLGMLVAIGLWWVYFDFVSHRIPRAQTSSVASWTYLHLPLVASIAAVGAAVLNLVEHVGDGMPGNVRWLLVGSVSVTLLCVALLINTLGSDSPAHQEIDNRSRNIMVI
ncbi:MAG: low temperature requirement protein A, partial [Gammaproteobacteria bacterium]|nr:low temperature requirement protein A [Gammaproteobacteria bacterium]